MASAGDLQPLPASLGVTSVVLKSYVDAGPVPDDAFAVEQSTVDAAAALPEGGAIVETLYLSVDPYMRPLLRLNKAHYAPSFELGKPPSGGAVVLVRASKAEGVAPGDVLVGRGAPWATFAALTPEALQGFRPVPRGLLGKLPLSYFLGTLGMPGLTAYSSIKRIAEPKAGETAFVSAASGAVGQVAGQLLKGVYGCRVVGSAGSADKVALLEGLGFDAAWNHREVGAREGLAKHCPQGVDIYFDNVGGETLEAVLDAANVHCRVVACGMISQYDLPPEKRYGVRNLFNVVGKQVRMQGFIVSDLARGLEAEFVSEVGKAVLEGKIKVIEDVTDGLENVPAAFRSLFEGKNRGKAVVRVARRDPFLVQQ